jgi:hypothetical protein
MYHRFKRANAICPSNETIVINLSEFGHGNCFLNMISKAQATKEKNRLTGFQKQWGGL